MKTLHLEDDVYQVWNNDETTCMFQGSKEECASYILHLKLSDPELIAVFKRLADR